MRFCGGDLPNQRNIKLSTRSSNPIRQKVRRPQARFILHTHNLRHRRRPLDRLRCNLAQRNAAHESLLYILLVQKPQRRFNRDIRIDSRALKHIYLLQTHLFQLFQDIVKLDFYGSRIADAAAGRDVKAALNGEYDFGGVGGVSFEVGN